MTSEWVGTTLGQLCEHRGAEIKTGPFGTKLKASEYSDHGAPLISVREIQVGRIVVEEKTPCIPESVQQRMPEYLLRLGDIVFARKGSVDRSALVAPEQVGYFLGSDALRVRLPSGICPRFVAYQVRSPKMRAWLEQNATGSTMPSLSGRILFRLPITLPPLPEQRRIVAVLGALDDKIELNRKMNRTLEEIAQAIFKSWFIDFDGVPPEDLEDSELGLIPSGWKVEPLDEVAHFLNGAACQKYPAVSDEPSLPVIKIRELNQGVTPASDRATTAIPKKWIVADGDVLFSWSGSLVVQVWTGGPGALNQHLFKVTSEKHPRWLFLLWTQHRLREFQRIAADKATTMGHIKRRHLTEAKCFIPPPEVIQRAGDLLGPVVERQVVNDLESRTLRGLRDTLLPKLISGEIRVPELDTEEGCDQ